MSDKVKEFKFTFNSAVYMKDFDVSMLNDIEKKPFKILQAVRELLFGAMNCDPKVKISVADVDAYLEEFMVEGSVSDLLSELMEKLQDSNFFKSLQRTKQPKSLKK